MKPHLTPKQRDDLIGHMVVICTTNEQKNDHITTFFDKHKIAYENRALKTGDYNFKIAACPDLGFPVDTVFSDELFIERKNSLTELAGSINKEAFHFELKRAQNIKHKFLIVEQPTGWEGILSHDYSTKYGEKSYWNTLTTFCVKYGITPIFVDKKHIGLMIYSICKSVLDQYIDK